MRFEVENITNPTDKISAYATSLHRFGNLKCPKFPKKLFTFKCALVTLIWLLIINLLELFRLFSSESSLYWGTTSYLQFRCFKLERPLLALEAWIVLT